MLTFRQRRNNFTESLFSRYGDSIPEGARSLNNTTDLLKGWSKKQYRWVGLVLIAAGMAFFLHTLRLNITAWKQSQWPTTKAQVLTWEFKPNYRWTTHNGHRDKEEWWTPNVSYRYVVNGKTYESSTISVYDTSDLSSSEYWDFSRRMQNCKVEIHYNPDQPQESVIMPFRSRFTVWLHLIVSILIWGAGGFLYLKGTSLTTR